VSSRFRIVALSVALVSSHALASESPPRDRALKILAELDKSGASRAAARDAVAEARRAIARADKARLAGDHKHGGELEALALEWAEAGRDIERTAAAEARAAALEKSLTQAEVKLRTTRTLIEQAAARRARADAELAELEESKKEAPAAASAKPVQPTAKPAPASETAKPGQTVAPKPAPSIAPSAAPPQPRVPR
jgi:pilus assembly protein FimV